MNVGSTFTGIGGLDLGLDRAGMRIGWQCESDAYRRGVLAARFPGVPVYEDIREVAAGGGGRPEPGVVGGDDRTSDVGRGGVRPADSDDRRIGLLCGGFPCQDLSVTGRRAGLSGERSGLFFEFARVASALQSRWLLVENVPGLLSSNGGRDFGVVLGTLADIGYGLAWRILDSRFFGVPQRRRRVYIVGTLAHGDPRAAAERAGQVLAVGARCDRHPAAGGEGGPQVASLFTGGTGDRGWRGDPEPEGFVSHALRASRGVGGGGLSNSETLVSFQAQGLDDPNLVISHGVRRLTPRECERLQGFPDDWTTGSDSRRYSALGDAVTVDVAEWIGRRIFQAA